MLGILQQNHITDQRCGTKVRTVHLPLSKSAICGAVKDNYTRNYINSLLFGQQFLESTIGPNMFTIMLYWRRYSAPVRGCSSSKHHCTMHMHQTQTIPGIGIEVLVFWPVLVLVLVLKIPNFQVLVLVLVLKNWFCRYWNWYWYWPQKIFIPQASALSRYPK